MKIKIKTAELVPDQYGQHIKISRVGLYDDYDKWIRWVKLNDALITELLKVEINIETK
jgi:hypothetical protein